MFVLTSSFYWFFLLPPKSSPSFCTLDSKVYVCVCVCVCVHVCVHLCVLVAQSCPTLCIPMDCSSPASSAHGILQVRILEWVVISFSRGSSRPRDWTWVSCIAGRFFTTLSHQGSPFWSVLLSISQTLHTCSYLTGLVFSVTLPRNFLFPDYHTTPAHLAYWYNLSTPLHMLLHPQKQTWCPLACIMSPQHSSSIN